MIISSAKGSRVFDSVEREYIDLTAFFGAVSLGHNNPALNNAISSQMARLTHTMGEMYQADVYFQFIESLRVIVPPELDEFFVFLNGSDAVDTALKASAAFTKKRGVLSFTGAYHGLFSHALEVTHNPFFREKFQVILSGRAVFAPYPDSYRTPSELDPDDLLKTAVDAFRRRISDPSLDIGAVIVEPILGRGGVITPPNGFLKELRRACDEFSVVLIIDEIFTGMGRCGSRFAFSDEGIVPDILCLGKGLGGGFPVSVCAMKGAIYKVFECGSLEAVHTATFMGNPISCAAGIAVISEMTERFLESVKSRGEICASRFRNWFDRFPFIGDVRGRGLMWGLDIVKERSSKEPDHALGASILTRALERGIILTLEGGFNNVIAITPPLTIDESDLRTALNILEGVLIEEDKRR